MSFARLIAGLKRAFLGVPLLGRAPGIALATAFVLAALMISQLQQAYVRLETGEVGADARMIPNVLAAGVGPMLRGDDVAGVHRLLDDLAGTSPTVHASRVQDGRGRLVKHKAPDGSEAKLVEATVPLPDFEVAGEAADEVLMDLTMPGRGGIGGIHDVCQPVQAISTSRLALGWPRRRREERKIHA